MASAGANTLELPLLEILQKSIDDAISRIDLSDGFEEKHILELWLRRRGK